MSLSVIHPSRGRPQQCYATVKKWMEAAHDAVNVLEWIISVDHNDPALDEYENLNTWEHLLVSNNRSCVDAVNVAASKAEGKLLVVVSDDFDPHPHWDKWLTEILTIHNGEEYGVLVSDGLQPKMETMTLPIISKKLYKKLSYIYHPSYFSMFADNDITEICKRKKLVNATHLTFQHNHFMNGAVKDDTYKRQNSPQAWAIGEAAFKQRKLENFGV